MKVFEYTIGNFTSTVVCADEQEFKRHIVTNGNNDTYTIIEETA